MMFLSFEKFGDTDVCSLATKCWFISFLPAVLCAVSHSVLNARFRSPSLER